MFTDLLLSKFTIKKSGDEGTKTDPKVDPKDNKPEDEQDDSEGEDDDGLALDSLDEKTKKYIKKLRDENAKRRTESNNLTTKMEKMEKGFKAMFGEEDDDTDPEEKVKTLSSQYESVVTENAILKLALENGIVGAENIEYFEFQMSKKLNSLQEGEEMTDEDLAEILGKCSKAGVKKPADTSVKGDKDKKPDSKPDEVTQEEFDKMGMIQKSNLYLKNPDLYKKLMGK